MTLKHDKARENKKPLTFKPVHTHVHTYRQSCIRTYVCVYTCIHINWDVVKDIALLLVFCCIVAFISHFLFLFHYHGLVVLIYIFGFYYYYYCIVIASNMIRGYDLLFVPSCPI